MDQFDRNVLLQYHQQAITHALAPQQGQKQIPCQLVFPDDTMTIGGLANSRGALFPTDREGAGGETEEERQQRLFQNEPIVVYTSLPNPDRPWEHDSLRPEIMRRSVALLVLMTAQAICFGVVFAGGAGPPLPSASAEGPGGEADDEVTPSPSQVWLYTLQLLLHPLFFASMYLWNVDLMKVYSVSVTLVFFMIMVLAMRSFLDMAACAFCVPIVLLTNSIRGLMMPHCFTVRR